MTVIKASLNVLTKRMFVKIAVAKKQFNEINLWRICVCLRCMVLLLLWMHSVIHIRTQEWHHRFGCHKIEREKPSVCTQMLLLLFFFFQKFLFFISFVTKFSNKSETKTNMRQTKHEFIKKIELKWKLFWMHTAAIKNLFACLFLPAILNFGKQKASANNCMHWLFLVG